jgi:hypothetical protein
MAIQTYISMHVTLIGDGVSLTATLVLDSTPLYTSSNIINYKTTPDSVTLLNVRDESGNPIPALAMLSHNGKQIIITFSVAFTGLITVTLNLGYAV